MGERTEYGSDSPNARDHPLGGRTDPVPCMSRATNSRTPRICSTQTSEQPRAWMQWRIDPYNAAVALRSPCDQSGSRAASATRVSAGYRPKNVTKAVSRSAGSTPCLSAYPASPVRSGVAAEGASLSRPPRTHPHTSAALRGRAAGPSGR